MKYKRSEIMSNPKSSLSVGIIFCVFITIVSSVISIYYESYNDKLLQENSEYLSVIEEYSIEYAELENKLKDYEDTLQDYMFDFRKYESQIKNYEAQIKKQKAKIKVYEIENEKYKEQLNEASQSNYTNTTESNDNVDYTSDSFTGNITGYCGCAECCGEYATDDEIKYGATGIQLISGYSVASDYYDMGTILYIEGYGEVQVADRFGAGHSKEYIDVYFDTHSEAWDWGRQYLTVSVVS